MTETLLELTEAEFDNQFMLLANHLNSFATWTNSQGQHCLFETYGAELEFIKQQDPNRLWTLVDGEDDDLYIISGFHYVNRLGYFVSREPVPDNLTIQVRIPMERDEEDCQP